MMSDQEIEGRLAAISFLLYTLCMQIPKDEAPMIETNLMNAMRSLGEESDFKKGYTSVLQFAAHILNASYSEIPKGR